MTAEFPKIGYLITNDVNGQPVSTQINFNTEPTIEVSSDPYTNFEPVWSWLPILLNEKVGGGPKLLQLINGAPSVVIENYSQEDRPKFELIEPKLDPQTFELTFKYAHVLPDPTEIALEIPIETN